jgi:hypothetical protein
VTPHLWKLAGLSCFSVPPTVLVDFGLEVVWQPRRLPGRRTLHGHARQPPRKCRRADQPTGPDDPRKPTNSICKGCLQLTGRFQRALGFLAEMSTIAARTDAP